MNVNITTIKLGKRQGNSYLIKTSTGYILIITGKKTNYVKLNQILTDIGCDAQNINLIIFTSYSSSNNKRILYFKDKYNTPIAIHVLDKELISYQVGTLQKIKNILKSKNHNEYKPDLTIDEGYNLSEFGLNARVLFLPGHSRSVGILTENGELFCDDLEELDNINKTAPNENSQYLIKLKNLLVAAIYPGRGDPLFL